MLSQHPHTGHVSCFPSPTISSSLAPVSTPPFFQLSRLPLKVPSYKNFSCSSSLARDIVVGSFFAHLTLLGHLVPASHHAVHVCGPDIHKPRPTTVYIVRLVPHHGPYIRNILSCQVALSSCEFKV
ncbi:hypothetical protein C8R47DRAFT_1325757 [Mycena vitilis]|nr:hypothetical protein C8R47DRAFT_1325757 [Mycena vitilis]